MTARTLLNLIEQQGYRCALTGWELTPDVAQVDHILPLSQGGEHVLSNLQVVHKDVNAMKGTLEMDRFIEICRAVVRTYVKPS